MRSYDISEELSALRVAALFAAYGKLDDVIKIGFADTSNGFWDWYYELLEVAMHCIDMDFVDEYEINTWYFSDENMMEYYRLCRTYGRAHRVKLKDNPFMREAQLAVENAMELGSSYGYGWSLNTKINHKWASGLILHTDCYFGSEISLIGALLDISDWYRDGVYRLRHQLLVERVFWLPALPAPMEGTEYESF